MSATTLKVEVPTSLLQFGIDQYEIQRRLNEWLAIALFTESCISSDKAAKVLGISRLQFLDLLRVHNIAYINYSAEELAEELAAVAQLAVLPQERIANSHQGAMQMRDDFNESLLDEFWLGTE